MAAIPKKLNSPSITAESKHPVIRSFIDNPFVTVLLIGTLGGVLTACIQRYTYGPFSELGNSYSAWLLMSFICGSIINSKRLSLVCGFLVQVFAEIGFYLLLYAQSGVIGDWSGDGFYLLGGILAGPVFGYCGYLTMTNNRRAWIGVSTIVSVFFSEAVYRIHYIGSSITNNEFGNSWYVPLACGTLIYLVYYKFVTNKKYMLFTIIPVTFLFFIGINYILPEIFSLIKYLL